MNRGERPDLCIYHGPSCHDGFGAAWAIFQRWPDVTFWMAQYGDELPPEGMIRDRNVLMVDFSFPETEMRALAGAARTLTVLDHHEGARELIWTLLDENLIAGEFNPDRSGAALAWDYAWGGGLPKMLAHIQDRDLWKFEVDGTHEVAAFLGSHEFDMGIWTELAKRIEDPGRYTGVIAEGAAILRAKRRDLAQLLEATKTTMVIDGVEVPCANVPYFWASDAGHALGAGKPFAATYFDRGDGVRQYSLRSDPDGMDVNEIAKRFGGGGHVHAAGFSLQVLEEPVNLETRGKVELVSEDD